VAKVTRRQADVLELVSGISPEDPGPPPAEQRIQPPRGCIDRSQSATKHGWHSDVAVQIPTSLTCNLCPLYHVKRKDRRHPLACPEGRKNQVCPILTHMQQDWACGLIREIEEATTTPPTPSDNARIEQIVRHRSRIFQIENFLKVAGLIDLQKGEVRNVADRLTTTENALSRVLAEFRQAMSERRASRQGQGPRLDEYLRQLGDSENDRRLPEPGDDDR
jgi:hypothetical protein